MRYPGNNHMLIKRIILYILAVSLPVVPTLAQEVSAPKSASVTIRADAEVDYLNGFSAAAPPSDDAQARALERVKAYAMALRGRDFSSAYAMLRLTYQAANPKVEWEMNLRNRGDLWANGDLQILRSSWTRNPIGQPAGSYAAFDFLGYRANGDLDCGYIVVHQAAEKDDFSIVRTDASYVPALSVSGGVPDADVMAQLPCFLGNVFAKKQ